MKNPVNHSLKGARIYVGLSGGVDSAVTAALLLQRSAEVTGVFIKGWYPPELPCTWASDRRDAMRVAAHLHIPFITLDASVEYKKGVMDYLVREYRAGRTPNPDIMCNREVKFGAFYRFAKKQGTDFIATGHYARVEHGVDSTKLLRGVDESKDQSYFLWAVPKEALAHTLFPLGGMHKQEVRKLAHSFRLPVAEKHDSQGICFLGSVSVDDFLRAECGSVPGQAIDAAGKITGTHDGAVLYTLGQRVTLADAPPGPWFVIAKDMEKNEITVAHTVRSEQNGLLNLSDTNWISDFREDTILEAQYRYHGPRISGKISQERSVFSPNSTLPETPAAGQSLVLYQNETCLGGGIISTT